MKVWIKVEKLDIRMQGIQCNYTNCYFNISWTPYTVIYCCITSTIRLAISTNWVSNVCSSQIIWGEEGAAGRGLLNINVTPSSMVTWKLYRRDVFYHHFICFWSTWMCLHFTKFLLHFNKVNEYIWKYITHMNMEHDRLTLGGSLWFN